MSAALANPVFPPAPVPALAPAAPAFSEFLRGAPDGLPLALRDFRPRGPARGAVLIAPAMGVAQRFYEPLATFLAAAGLRVITFDYRGIGASRLRRLADEPADIMTWAELDAATALAALAERAPGLPITWLGHSLGGQIIPFVPGHERIAKAVLVATGSGYWRTLSRPLRRRAPLLWYGLVPTLIPLFGYFPGRRFGVVGDVPGNAMRQWRAACLHPDYLAGIVPGAYERYAAFTRPLTSIALTDDEMMSDAGITALYDRYAAAPRRLVRLDPAELDVPRIGHFGFFKKEMQAPLWQAHLLPELAQHA